MEGKRKIAKSRISLNFKSMKISIATVLPLFKQKSKFRSKNKYVAIIINNQIEISKRIRIWISVQYFQI